LHGIRFGFLKRHAKKKIKIKILKK
jgi:hypothetical protein